MPDKREPQTVRLTGYVDFPIDELDSVRAALEIHIHETRQEPGCLLFEVREDSKNTGRFQVTEEFISRDAFAFHQTRARNSAWAEASKNGIRSYKIQENPPDV